MRKQFVPDKEIFLSKDNDYLKTGVYSQSLTKIIKNTPSNDVFTIGLFGNWGTGKSSIIETSKNQIEQDGSKVKFIIYDAWKYANDSFRRMFLLKIQEDLRQEQTEDMKRFYQSENAEAKPRQVLNITGVSIVVSALIVLVVIVSSLNIRIEWKTPIISILTLLGLLISVLNGFFHSLKISINKPSLFAPEQFEDCFKQMMWVSLKKENCIIASLKKLVEYVRKGKTTIVGLDKIVIVIDNIDRCHSAMAYQLLTDIKTFLSNERYNLVFVIPVDDEALKKHLFGNSSKHEDHCNHEKEEFLRKFFNVTMRIKPHQQMEMQVFARELNKKYTLGFNDDTLSLSAKEFATNPRRIIQLFNNLLTELTLYSDGFVSKNEAVICAIIILREEFHEFYKAAINDVKLLKDTSLLQDKYKTETELLSFMRIANPVFQNTETSDILQILTNTKSLFSSIPIDIQEAIRTNNAQDIIYFFNFKKVSKSLTDDILKLIYKHIEDDVKYGSEFQMINWIEFVAKVFCDTPSVEELNIGKFDEVLKSKYQVLIPKTTQPSSICPYAWTLSLYGFNALKQTIIQYLLNPGDQKPSNWDDYVKKVLRTFNDEEDSKSLAPFAEKYFIDNPIDKGISYTGEQKKYLFTDKVVQIYVDNIVEHTENESLKELIWIFKNKPNISSATYEAFFSRINDFVGEMKNKTKDEILLIVKFLMQFMNSIPNNELRQEPQKLYDKVFGQRGITTNQAHANPPLRVRKIKVIDECKNNKEESNLLIDFAIQVYATTNGNITISEQIAALTLNNRTYINSKLVELLDARFDLTPLFGIIIEDEDYSSANTIKLIKSCFMLNQGGNLYLSEEQIKMKIKSLLNHLSNNYIVLLVNQIISNSHVKQTVVAEIVGRDTKFINSLPTPLMNLAVEAFNANTAKAYANNYNYLVIIAQKGDDTQKTELVKLLATNIISNQNIQEVLSILEVIRIEKKTDKDLIVAQLNSYKENASATDDETVSRINCVISKFMPEAVLK